jgi:copper(I)-binding protein
MTLSSETPDPALPATLSSANSGAATDIPRSGSPPARFNAAHQGAYSGRMRVRATLTWMLMVAVEVAGSHARAAGVITVNEPWVRPGVVRQRTEVYFVLTSSEPLTLVGARTAAAATVTIRGPGATGRVLPKLVLVSGSAVRLAPGANRLELGGLQRSLKMGDRVSIVLVLESADGSRREIPVDAEVRRHSPNDDERHAHGHAH